jgi:hypothetical protein
MTGSLAAGTVLVHYVDVTVGGELPGCFLVPVRMDFLAVHFDYFTTTVRTRKGERPFLFFINMLLAPALVFSVDFYLQGIIIGLVYFIGS